ncbi:hypothetical protein ACN42_g2484 [Penicillium freii]|uniref:Uncharacterized protein n=1 Tax=Penicillium freii TaxID=48697 RepID=A0A101MQ39_PENFR|nr:hypothetical protein ACN42_g2484 [Penicillium freii]
MLQALALYHLVYTLVYTVVSSLEITLCRAEKPRRLRGVCPRPPDFIRPKVVERFLMHWQPYLPHFVTNNVSFADQSDAVLSAFSMSRLSKSIYST